jgi:hypothetical protein
MDAPGGRSGFAKMFVLPGGRHVPPFTAVQLQVKEMKLGEKMSTKVKEQGGTWLGPRLVKPMV